MEFNKIVSILLCFIFAGCSAHAKFVKPNPLEENSIYMQGYKDGVKKNIQGVVEKLNGNDFPYYGEWAEPITQNVKVPAAIQNGVFIPEHYQTILIVPGEWKKNQAYPIKAEKMENKENESTLQNVSVNVDNITVMPKQYSISSDEVRNP